MRIINRTVWILSFVSLFADMASELLYPVIPVYLKEIGFSVLLIGVLEGLAEGMVGISKGYFGKLSDEKKHRLPFVQLGYFLSAVSKPMMALLTVPLWIFFSRTIDRVGKGLRSSARDGLLSAAATPATKAAVFGFHRSMDTLGAVAGPLLALLFLYVYPAAYKTLFYLAFIPGMIAVLLLFSIKEPKAVSNTSSKKSFFSYLLYWKESSVEYKKLIRPLLLFALGNSSDVFLLLKTRAITQSDTLTIAAYIFYNLVFAVSSFPLGKLADKWGHKKIITAGLFLFIIVYTGFAMATSTVSVFILLGIYGLYAAGTEGVIKASITNVVAAEKTGTALGFYSSMQSLLALSASILAGLLWSVISDAAPFYWAAFTAAVAIMLLKKQQKFTINSL
jgi:MFS family permease